MVDELERLRLQRILSDWITGLPLYPVADLRNERVSNLGVIYLQLGRFAGVESVYGWELYDQVLRCVTESLQADVEASTLRSSFLSIQFTGCDGFYLLFDVAPGGDPQVRHRVQRKAGDPVAEDALQAQPLQLVHHGRRPARGQPSPRHLSRAYRGPTASQWNLRFRGRPARAPWRAGLSRGMAC